ncbi:MAG: hypothetical protein ACM3H8_16755 [Sphingobacteriales bacterium]
MKKALFNFSKFSDAALEVKAQAIYSNLNGNSSYATPSPALTLLQAAITAFSDALNTSSTGTRSDIAFKNQKRQELVDLLRSLAAYVNFAANGDESVLLDSGFDVSKDPGTITITKPENLQVVNGNNPGVLMLSVDSVKGAKSYLFEYTTDITLAEQNWQSFPSTKAKYILEDLMAGTKYYCRVGAVSGNNQLLYSDAVSRMVI